MASAVPLAGRTPRTIRDVVALADAATDVAERALSLAGAVLDARVNCS